MSDLLISGKVAVTGTAQPLTAQRLESAEFIVRANPGNSANVEIGGSDLTLGNGYQLAPGEPFSFEYNVVAGRPLFDRQPGDLYVVGTSGDSVSWIATGRV